MSVDGGYLRTSKVYHIGEFDRYSPGFFQTMLFPCPEVLWDNLEVRPSLDEFRLKLAERLRYEATRSAHEMLRLSFAHPGGRSSHRASSGSSTAVDNG